jgi:hypothetical protein
MESWEKLILKKLEISPSKRTFGAYIYYLLSTGVDKFSVKGPFILSGPEIRSDVQLKKPIYLTDIAPILSRLLKMPFLRYTQGNTLFESFE